MSNRSVQSSLLNAPIFFALQIAESFRRFGIADTTTSLIAIKLATSSTITLQSVHDHLTSTFEGEMVEFCDKSLAHQTDLARVRKIYKLNYPIGTVRNKSREANEEVAGVSDEVALRELEMSILGLMALRGAG